MMLSRLAAPKVFHLDKRKGIKWVAKPVPGPHPLKVCIPLCIMLKNMGYAATAKEVRYVLQHNEILVDNVRRKNPRFPVGFMDTIAIPKTNEYYRVLFDKKGRFYFKKIGKEESVIKPCRIIGKRVLKKGIVQLNLYDSKNLLLKKDNYNVNDTVFIDITAKKSKTHENLIKKHIRLEKGALVYITAGSYTGEKGVLEAVDCDKIRFKLNNKLFETAKRYSFAIDETI